MFRTLVFTLFLGAVVGAATAQPVSRPTVTAPGRVPVRPPVSVRQPVLTLPLAREEAERLRLRLRASVARQAAAAPGTEALRRAGLPEESDAVEHAAAAKRTGTAGPIWIGLVRVLPPGPKDAVDPALADVTRSSLRARLDREPSPAEFAAELEVFDTRVERANRWLADNRVRIAKAYRSAGAMPPDFDAAALDPAPTDRQPDSAEVRAGFRALFRSLLAQPDPAAPGTPQVTPPDDPIVPGSTPRARIPTMQPDPGTAVRDRNRDTGFPPSRE